MAARTDIHSPSNLVTEDYQFVNCGDNAASEGDTDSWVIEKTRELKLLVSQSDPMHRGTHQCHHCGAHLRYFAVMLHIPSGDYIAIGETCLDNRFELATAEFHRLRKLAELDRQSQKIKAAASEWLDANVPVGQLKDCLAKHFDLSMVDGLEGWGLRTFTDIRRKLWQYGNMSSRQLDLCAKILAEIPKKAARQAEREAEVNVPAPVGRVAFTGVIVSCKFHDNEFGGAWKITVKVSQDNGVWLAWLTRPAAICDAEIGDVVSMTASLTRSSDSPHFAFGKRPNKATIVSRKGDDLPPAL